MTDLATGIGVLAQTLPNFAKPTETGHDEALRYEQIAPAELLRRSNFP